MYGHMLRLLSSIIVVANNVDYIYYIDYIVCPL